MPRVLAGERDDGLLDRFLERRHVGALDVLAQLPDLTAGPYRKQVAKRLSVTTQILDRAVRQRRRDLEAQADERKRIGDRREIKTRTETSGTGLSSVSGPRLTPNDSRPVIDASDEDGKRLLRGKVSRARQT